jgi:hypothetical protein
MKSRIFSMILLAVGLLTLTAQTKGQQASCANEGFRDFYEDCKIEVTLVIGLVNVRIEASGSKNNCLKSEFNSCTGSSCSSPGADIAVSILKSELNKL